MGILTDGEMVLLGGSGGGGREELCVHISKNLQ